MKVRKIPSCAAAPSSRRLGIGNQGTKVRARANAHEDQAGINAQLNAQVQVVQQARADGFARGGHQFAQRIEHLTVLRDSSRC